MALHKVIGLRESFGILAQIAVKVWCSTLLQSIVACSVGMLKMIVVMGDGTELARVTALTASWEIQGEDYK